MQINFGMLSYFKIILILETFEAVVFRNFENNNLHC